ncbi:MAG: homocysteine S-methyltransferase family protein [Desulfobacterales bacterium]|nr:homocysteine S-methyltransferase family protein [Desulfobacterales bacterium]
MDMEVQPRIPLLLDGGMGRELFFRGVEIPETIWSAGALIGDPEAVRRIHEDYIAAGADIITTNTYGIIRSDLAKEGVEDRFAQLNRLACALAIEARERTSKPVLIAGSLPPLRGSFRPDRVGPTTEIGPLYREQAQLLAPHVDLLLCETMSSAAEGRMAAEAACETAKPVWISWTLHEDRPGRLRSGETIAQAARALNGLSVVGMLVNCCAPERASDAMTALAATGARFFGAYANTFAPIPPDWTLDGGGRQDGLLEFRADLDPEAYAVHTARWLDAGATVVGGCCGTRPAHIALIREQIDTRCPLPER